MPKKIDPATTTVSVRLPQDLLAGLDAYVELLKKEMPMANRSDGLRSLVAERMRHTKRVRLMGAKS